MTTTSFKMHRHFIALFLTITVLVSCNKTDEAIKSNSGKPFTESAEVLDKWMTMQLRLMRNAVGIPNHALSRHFVYAGIAAFESMAPGIPAHVQWATRWNGLSGLPSDNPAVNYYYPSNVNAALAAINKAMFPNANATDKLAIDSLENALNTEFMATKPAALVNNSAVYGKAVAAAVFNWSETDGYKTANSPYTIPTGPGLWEPTAPAYAAPATPYWGNNRPVIIGSTANTQPAPPITYSTDPNSPFYQMVKQLFDASQTLTTDQKNMAAFWRDVPGVSSPGHWVSILQQAIRQENSSLDRAALAYALVGAAVNDGLISCFESKYRHTLVRPITYIRNVMGHTTWNSFLGTPAHPEYASAHTVLSIAAATVMEKLFGDVDSFTDHTYDYLGYPARSFPSYISIGEEAAQSRFYAGIHYQATINASTIQGKKVAMNIFSHNPNN